MKINDKQLVSYTIDVIGGIIKNRLKDGHIHENFEGIDHPLDEDIKKELEELKSDWIDEANHFYHRVDKINDLWSLLIKKAIICLRFFDDREPFTKFDKGKKKPIAHGINELSSYYNKYAEFEGMLYSSNKAYRDHVIHVFRVWLIGIYCMTCDNSDGKIFIDSMTIDNNENIEVNFFEKVSMWTIIALCHDLGYPLEKAQKIFSKTKEMMDIFVSNSKIWTDISFTGVQDIINDYIVKFISSKMITDQDDFICKYEPKTTDNITSQDKEIFTVQVQPKYYIKLTKSLEQYRHGIISSIILFKMLLYFIESDYKLNENYKFNKEDMRQFYIRREILRAIASHTCWDIYHMRATTFESILIHCDEMQEWGRKSWNNFYEGTNGKNIEIDIKEFSNQKIDIVQEIKNIVINRQVISDMFQKAYEQFNYYKTVFRDGQDTEHRKFDFKKIIVLHCKDINGNISETYKIIINIEKSTMANFKVSFKTEASLEKSKHQDETRAFVESVFKDMGDVEIIEEN